MQKKPSTNGERLGGGAERKEERAVSALLADQASNAAARPVGEDLNHSGDTPRSAQAPSKENTTTFVSDEAPESSQTAEVVRQTTIRVLSERIRLLGVDRSGAYEHYNLLLSRGFPIPSYEIAILELVRGRMPHLRSYHEIGSGLGTLPLMLAHDGFAAVGVERDDRRHLTATTILRELSAQIPHVETNCRLLGAAFPDAVTDLDVSDSMAILTDFVASQNPQDYRRLCRGLARYRYVLLDLQRFCVKRESRGDQEKLVEELAAYGLSRCQEAIDLESEGNYLLFEAASSSEPPQAGEVSGDSDEPSEVVTPKIKADASSNQLQLVVAARAELAVIPEPAVPARASAAQSALQSSTVLPPNPQRALRSRFGGRPAFSALLVIGIPFLLAVAYYGLLASNQYVTTFQFAVRGPSQAAAARAGGAGGASAMSPDAFVVTDYINSPQAIGDVGHEVDLRTIFSKSTVDFWSRLNPDVTPEQLNAYWTNMVWAHFDLISGNVSVSVRAFTPQDSFKLAQALITASDQMFRKLNTQAQQDYVRLADENVKRAEQQLAGARQALLDLREKSGLIDPDKTAQAGSAIVDELRKQLAGFQAQYASIQAVSPKSPNLPSLNSQIVALESQIRNQEQQPGSSAVKAVTAEALGRYQSLDLERQFAEKQYTEALGLRNQVYLTAQNQQSYLALFVEPILPQTSRYPERMRAIMNVLLAAAAAWFFGMLITYAVRDHLT